LSDKTSKDLPRDLAGGGLVIDSSAVQHRLVKVGKIARRLIKEELVTTKMVTTLLQ